MAGALLAAAIAATSGCGKEADTAGGRKEPAPSASPSPSWHSATLQDAALNFQKNFQELTTADCSADCGTTLGKVFNAGLLLRDRMKTSGAPDYDEPIRLFDELEKGFTTAAGLSGQARLPPMLGPARKLNNWLNTHPIQ